ncbi:MAG TPA: hypothetical protein VFY23_01635 [Candidatus Limnocylindrales bacterium]|nr:hypothetical protein [Candidatus Limnocylindrales bacterium]
MRDPATFEARLADAFDRYAASAPVDVDARTLAAAIARPRARGPIAARWAAAPRWVVVLGLVAAGALGAALLAGALLRSEPGLLGGGGRIVVIYPVGPSSLVTLDDDGADVREVALRGCPMVSGTAEATITRERFEGTSFTGFDGGVSAPISHSYAGGERWSPDNRTLAMLKFDEGEVTFARIENGDVENPVLTTVPLDLRAAGVDVDGRRSFNGDFSQDGRQLLVRTWPDASGTSLLLVVPVTVDPPRLLAEIGSTGDQLYGGATWSGDASAVAVLGVEGGVPGLAVIPTDTGVVRWLGRPAGVPADAALTVERWSPDGSRVGVWADGFLHLVDVGTAQWTRTRVPGPTDVAVALSPDGRLVGTIGGSTLTVTDTGTGDVRARQLGGFVTAWSPDRSAIAVVVPAGDKPTAEVRVLDPWTDAAPTVVAVIPRDQGPTPPAPDPNPCIQWLPEVQP